jgi:L-lactate dehydrogenase complex protein LldF
VTEAPVRFIDRAAMEMGTHAAEAVRDGARRMAANRREAFGAYPAGEAMRDRARAIRLHTLANLDRYLAEFADAFTTNGGHVHFAADATEANAMTLEIAHRHEARRVVKSKSMVTEEIELNHALEAEGIEVIETDLGEFIVQLGDDRPSHIIAPVLHLTRTDIGHLFAEQLGVDFTEDPTLLNAIARRHLRSRFLEADMGVSGVNFAIADTGSICLVTNEGNGRMITTAPRVHVAVMGMERIVPTFAHLATLTEVLARSGTGQPLSVYTNVLTGPRRPGDPDGPDAVHVIIVDNGRSSALSGVNAEILACIRCGACLNVCPVYNEVGGHAYGDVYAGPIGAVVTPLLRGMDTWHDLPHASSLCGACEEACPVRIDIPRMLLELRAEAAERGHADRTIERALRAYAAAAVRPRRFRRLLKLGGLAGRVVPKRDGWIGSLPGPGRAWTAHRDLPPPARESFHEWWRRNRGS